MRSWNIGAPICDALYAGDAGGAGQFLAPAVAQYGLRLEDFLTILDGMEMDVAEDIVAPDLRHAGSLLRPGGQRGGAAFHQGVRHGGGAGL